MADEYVSGEEYRRLHETSSKPPDSSRRRPERKLLIIIVAVVVLCGLSFAGGMAYQKHSTKSSTQRNTATNGQLGRGQGMGGGFRRNGSIGQVTAVSDTSITVDDQRSDSSKTFTINSNTAISDDGQTGQVSDIKTGDTVLISTSSTTSTTATRILVNPNFGGSFGGGGQDQPQPTTQ